MFLIKSINSKFEKNYKFYVRLFSTVDMLINYLYYIFVIKKGQKNDESQLGKKITLLLKANTPAKLKSNN